MPDPNRLRDLDKFADVYYEHLRALHYRHFEWCGGVDQKILSEVLGLDMEGDGEYSAEQIEYAAGLWSDLPDHLRRRWRESAGLRAPLNLTDEEVAMWNDGALIVPAIKAYRIRTGASLKMAVDAFKADLRAKRRLSDNDD